MGFSLLVSFFRLYAITVPIAIELDSGNELQITGSAIGGNAIVDLLEVGSIQAVNSRQFVVTGAAAIDGNLILDIVRQPGFYYVVVFTVDYPNGCLFFFYFVSQVLTDLPFCSLFPGAVRGQLMLPNAGVEVSVSDSNLDVWNGNSLGTTGVGGVGGVGTTGTALGGGLGVGAGLGAGGGLGTGAGVTGIAAGGAGLGGATGVAGGIP